MELTFNNLIVFLENEYPYGIGFSKNTNIREDCSTDGIAAIYFLENLKDEFNVSFDNFLFTDYFFSEQELSFSWSTLFKVRREISKALTVQLLFDYMVLNIKQT
jgi:Protein of unknown function (DUF1493)